MSRVSTLGHLYLVKRSLLSQSHLYKGNKAHRLCKKERVEIQIEEMERHLIQSHCLEVSTASFQLILMTMHSKSLE